MKVVDIPLTDLRPAGWSPNRMDPGMLARLEASIQRFDILRVLVVRRLPDAGFEVLSGNQLLPLLRQRGDAHASCVVVDVDDANARLVAQAMNAIHGEDDPGLKAELFRAMLERLSEQEVTALLPETSASLQALASLGQQDMAEHLVAWQDAQRARLKHLQLQLTNDQLEVVQAALDRAMQQGLQDEGSPNRRGTAMVAVCRAYLAAQEAAS